MYDLPLTGTATREMMGDIAHVATLLHPDKVLALPRFSDALRKGRAFMETADNAASRVTFICWGNCNIPKQHGKVVMISVGRRGGWKLEWVFGDGR
jgi:hypothetical protein